MNSRRCSGIQAVGEHDSEPTRQENRMAGILARQGVSLLADRKFDVVSPHLWSGVYKSQLIVSGRGGSIRSLGRSSTVSIILHTALVCCCERGNGCTTTWQCHCPVSASIRKAGESSWHDRVTLGWPSLHAVNPDFCSS